MRVSANALAIGFVGLLLIWCCRWIARRDATAGWIVSAGLVLRLWTGLALFWVSYLRLPLLSQLYTGDGFWLLAPDARSYYQLATQVADQGVRIVNPSAPSPAFIQLLGIWMRALGTSPATCVLLNSVAYCGIAVVLLLAFVGRESSLATRQAFRLSLLGFTFSPGLVLFGSQVLKDQLFCFLVVSACAAVWMLLRPHVIPRGPHEWRSTVVGFGVMLTSIYLIAGIRAYVAFLIICVLGAVLAAFATRRPLKDLPVYTAVSVLLILALWLPFKYGARNYYPYYETRLLSLVGVSSDGGFTAVVKAREGFVESAGGTNFARRPSSSRRNGPSLSAGEESESAAEEIRKVTVGAAVLTIPISILKASSIVEIEGGRGLLSITDIDTAFVDVTCLVIVAFLVHFRDLLRRNAAYIAFTAGLVIVLGLLMAYVVTNFGTIFRLRLVLGALMWMLPLAVSQADAADSSAAMTLETATVVS